MLTQADLAYTGEDMAERFGSREHQTNSRQLSIRNKGRPARVHTDHRVGRVLSLFSNRRNWDFPNPSSADDCSPHLPRLWGEGHTRWEERGWESPNSDKGTLTVVLFDEGTYTVVLFIYTYFVIQTVHT